MAYNIIDIIDKAIKVDEKTKDLITKEAKEKEKIKPIQVMSKVMNEQVNISIKYYEELKVKMANKELADVDFMTYDKISFLVNEFNSKTYCPKINNAREFLMFTYELSKERYSLFIDIQGRLVNNTGDSSSEIYMILMSIIDNINKQIKNIEEVLNKKYTT